MPILVHERNIKEINFNSAPNNIKYLFNYAVLRRTNNKSLELQQLLTNSKTLLLLNILQLLNPNYSLLRDDFSNDLKFYTIFGNSFFFQSYNISDPGASDSC